MAEKEESNAKDINGIVESKTENLCDNNSQNVKACDLVLDHMVDIIKHDKLITMQHMYPH